MQREYLLSINVIDDVYLNGIALQAVKLNCRVDFQQTIFESTSVLCVSTNIYLRNPVCQVLDPYNFHICLNNLAINNTVFCFCFFLSFWIEWSVSISPVGLFSINSSVLLHYLLKLNCTDFALISIESQWNWFNSDSILVQSNNWLEKRLSKRAHWNILAQLKVYWWLNNVQCLSLFLTI